MRYALVILVLAVSPASAHDWFDRVCCSDKDCRVIACESIEAKPDGFHIMGHPEIIPYASRKLRITPAKGEGQCALCTRSGGATTPVICVYRPPDGF